MVELWALVPITAIVALFGSVILIVKYIVDYRTNVRRLATEGGGEYRKLAEEAVQGQRVLLDEVRALNQTLREIERILREV